VENIKKRKKKKIQKFKKKRWLKSLNFWKNMRLEKEL
jgi:hypothetical protein